MLLEPQFSFLHGWLKLSAGFILVCSVYPPSLDVGTVNLNVLCKSCSYSAVSRHSWYYSPLFDNVLDSPCIYPWSTLFLSKVYYFNNFNVYFGIKKKKRERGKQKTILVFVFRMLSFCFFFYFKSWIDWWNIYHIMKKIKLADAYKRLKYFLRSSSFAVFWFEWEWLYMWIT